MYSKLTALILDGVIARSIAWAKSVRLWLGVLVAVGALVGGVAGLLWAQGEEAGAFWVLVGLAVLVTYWALIALYAWSEVGWVRRVNSLLILTGGFGVVIGVLMAGGFTEQAQTLGVVYLTLAGFMAGVNLLRLVLQPGYPIIGVARTMIEEALRMRVALIIIIVYLVGLALMPTLLGSEDRVTYMVQRFLVYASGLIIFSLGLLTVLMGAYSVSRDLSSRQMQMTLTKPLSRWQYLVGKWLGIVLLNAVLVAVAGIAIVGFTRSIAQNPALDDLDRYQVQREILTARTSHSALPKGEAWEQWVTNFLERPGGKRDENPEVFGKRGDPLGVIPEEDLIGVFIEAQTDFYTVDADVPKEFRFEGLTRAVQAAKRSSEEAKALLIEDGLTDEEAQEYLNYAVGLPNELTPEIFQKIAPPVIDAVRRVMEREVIQLVLTPDTSPEPGDKRVEVRLRFNGRAWPPVPPGADPLPRALTLETPNSIPIPPSLISNDGTLAVTVEVPPKRSRDGQAQKYLQFNYKDAQLQLFYRATSFEMNMARAMFVVWLKLALLAMLGLVSGSLLSFPVAAMVGIIFFIAALVSGVIQESLDTFISVGRGEGTWQVITGFFASLMNALGQGDIYGVFKLALRLIGEGFMLLVPSFGSYGTADPLSEGRAIGNDMVLGALLKIGVIWTGVIGLAGIYFFSRKELARVTV